MEGEFIVHIPEEHVNRGGVNSGSVASNSSRGSYFSAQMCDDNSTISSTGSNPPQQPYDWHAGSMSSGNSVAGNGSLSSTEPQDSQSSPNGSELVQQIPPPQHVRAEDEHRQNKSATHRLRQPKARAKGRSDLPRLIEAFSPSERQEEVIDEKQRGRNDEEQGRLIDREQGEIIEEEKGDRQATNQTGEQRMSTEAGEDKVSMEEFTDEMTKAHRMKLREGFDETVSPRLSCFHGNHLSSCQLCWKYFKPDGWILIYLITLILVPLMVKTIIDFILTCVDGIRMVIMPAYGIWMGVMLLMCLSVGFILPIALVLLSPHFLGQLVRFLRSIATLSIIIKIDELISKVDDDRMEFNLVRIALICSLAEWTVIVALCTGYYNKALAAMYVMELVEFLIFNITKFSLLMIRLYGR